MNKILFAISLALVLPTIGIADDIHGTHDEASSAESESPDSEMDDVSSDDEPTENRDGSMATDESDGNGTDIED